MKLKKYGIGSYNCIIFEILYNPKQPYSIKMYMDQHSDKGYLCTGDIHQWKHETCVFKLTCNYVNKQIRKKEFYEGLRNHL